jgi:hypothetical protein
MRRQIVTVSSATTSATIPVDHRAQNFQIGMGAVVTGTATFTVEYTFDDALGAAPVTWFPHPTMTAVTANTSANVAFPISALRLNVAATTGSVTLTILQSSGQG